MKVDLEGKPSGKGPDDAMNIIISKIEGVQLAAYKEAQKIGKKASAILEGHRHPGDDTHAEIKVERGDVDSYVSLVDPAARAIEYGHRDAKTGRPVKGLYIIHNAAGVGALEGPARR